MLTTFSPVVVMVLPTTMITTMYTHSTVQITDYALFVSSVGFSVYLSLMALMGIQAPIESLRKVTTEGEKVRAGDKLCRFRVRTNSDKTD